MAIIERVEGLEAIVKVGGTALPEYDDLNGDDDVEQVESLLALASKNRFVDARMIRHVVKYVEAISDAEFEVVFTKRQSFQHHSHHIAFQLENDNHAFGLTHEPEECREKEWNYSCEHRAFLDGEKNWCRQHFKFGPLRLVKPAASTSNPHDPYIDPHRDLGVLRISVHHMQFTNAIELPFGHVQSVTDSINEEALKGQTVTHIVHYGDLEPSKEPKDIPMDVYQDPLQRPFAIFEFRYLSKGDLF
ncbi:hypothetical protein BKA67DRAFT_341974 [Truncatella angustata]|uniref:DUF7918 domain-containing protein n=1 Tax=Truncatella angustata TaxID=152316 RepID=A0A9P8UGU0_9PEZI|nr:uncharacterized protein BKA67DRAFT_341974 [Truncatella angustata]KAH6651926.1 hypothetical protein BKA67DRAFT_341974 [Truncatella angustata]